MWQAMDWLLTGSALGASTLYLWRRWRAGNSSACGTGCGGCKASSAAPEPQLVQIGRRHVEG